MAGKLKSTRTLQNAENTAATKSPGLFLVIVHCPFETRSVLWVYYLFGKYSKMNILLPLETMAHDVTSQLQTKY